jgi:hypothetical protein
VIRSTGNLFQFNSTSLNFNRTKGSQARPEIMKTIDVTDYYIRNYGNSVVKAERRGSDVLVLYDEGDHFELSYRWLVSEHADLCRVLGSEVSRWDKNEVDPTQPLFEQFRLFP